ncbi:hypothetical protein V8E51_019115 [Hyaloscypha variabilis]
MCLRQRSTKYVQNVLLLSTKLLLSHDRVTKPQKPQRLPTIVTRERSSLSRVWGIGRSLLYASAALHRILHLWIGAFLCMQTMQTTYAERSLAPGKPSSVGGWLLVRKLLPIPSLCSFSVHLHHPSPQASKPPLRTELHTGWRLSKMRCNATVPFVASAFTAASQLTSHHNVQARNGDPIPFHSHSIPAQCSARRPKTPNCRDP